MTFLTESKPAGTQLAETQPAVMQTPTETQAPLPSAERFYYPEIDGLRLLAFALVFIHHLSLPNLSLLGDSALARGISIAVIQINANGWVGVDLFFVISGFLISSILLKERNLTGNISLEKFYMRRAYRIFPVYFLVIAITGAAALAAHEQPISKVLINVAAFSAFIGNFGMAFRAFAPLIAYTPFWSVCVEEQFYLVWGGILKKVRNVQSVVQPLFCVYLAGIVLRTAFALMHPGSFRQFYFNSFTHLDGLICGVFLALFAEKWLKLLRSETGLAKGLQYVSFAMIGAALMLGNSKSILMTLTPPLWTLVIAATIAGGSAFFRHPLVMALGRRTYSMYLWQIACILYIAPAVSKYFPNLNGYVSLLIFGAVLALSELTWRLVEKPFANRKRMFATVESGAST